MELLEVVKYSILLPSQNIPQRLAKGIASFLEIFNSLIVLLRKTLSRSNFILEYRGVKM